MKMLVALIHIALMGQVLAFQAAGSRSDPCASNQLEQARRAFRGDDLSLAAKLAKPLLSCPGSLGEETAGFWTEIKTRRHNERLWQWAQLLIRQSKFEAACKLLYEIGETVPDFPNLQAATKAASCNPQLEQLRKDLKGVDQQIENGLWEEARKMLDSFSEEHSVREEVRERRTLVEEAINQARLEAAARDYQKAMDLFDQGDLGGARTRLQRVFRNQKSHREARALLNKVNSRLASAEKSRMVSQLTGEARELAAAGDLSSALQKIEEALGLDESAPQLMDLQQELGERLEQEETRLREAVQSYYTGHYAEAIARLRGCLGERHRPRFAATASFFLGASLVSVSLRSKEDAPPGLGAARQHFRESRETDPEFVAPLESVSPKVRAVFSEAVGQ